MNKVGQAIFLWGVICLLGFGVYQWTLMDPGFPQPMILWSVLTVIGIAAMVRVPAWTKHKVVHTWIVVAGGGMIYHWLVFLQMLPPILPTPLFPWAYWALIMALGFFATGYFMKNNFWHGVGVLNALVFLLLMVAPGALMMYQSLILGIVSGVPLIYFGWKS